MNAQSLISKLTKCLESPTWYVMGGFGARLGKDYVNYQYKYNRENRAGIEAHYNTNPLTFGFDCVGLIKACLFFGFEANQNEEFGGAKYNSEQDITISAFKKSCPSVSTDFSEGATEAGELVFIGTSHIGVHIGNGEVIECTPAWKGCVQKTLLPWRNSTNYDALPVRAWDCHGKSSFIDYNVDWKKAYEDLRAKSDKAIADRDETIKGLNAKIEAAQNALKTAQDALSEADERYASLAQELMQSEAESVQIEDSLKEKLAIAEAERERLENEVKTLTKDNVLLKDNLSRAEEEVWAVKQEMNRLKAEHADMNGDGQATLADVFKLLGRVLRGNRK